MHDCRLALLDFGVASPRLARVSELVEHDRSRERAAATLQHAHPERARSGLESEAQRRGRGLVGGLRRPEQHRDAAPALGGDLQAAELRIFHACRRPCEHGAAGIRAQALLDGPERFLRRARSHDQHTLEIDTRCGERRRIGEIGRCDPRDETLFAGESRERRAEETQLADALVRGQDFGERARRPAAARQRGIERGEARRHTRARDLGEIVAAPDVVPAQDFAEGFVHG